AVVELAADLLRAERGPVLVVLHPDDAVLLVAPALRTLDDRVRQVLQQQLAERLRQRLGIGRLGGGRGTGDGVRGEPRLRGGGCLWRGTLKAGTPGEGDDQRGDGGPGHGQPSADTRTPAVSFGRGAGKCNTTGRGERSGRTRWTGRT